MSGAEVAILATVLPVGLGILSLLYRIGSIMGRIDEKLGDHERRLTYLESRTMPRSR